jgi:predicted transcriptional regulator
MSAPRTRASRVFTISFPEELAKQVVAVAEEESRTISELFREAFRTYRVERIRRKLPAAFVSAAEPEAGQRSEYSVEPSARKMRGEQTSRKRPGI